MNAAAWTISIIAVGIAIVLALRWERGSRAAKAAAGAAGGAASGSSYEFMSVPWIAMARREITNALSQRELAVRPFTLSEEFTDPPQHLARGARTIGFFVRVGEGRVEVGDRPAPDADCRVISDYTDAVALARDRDAATVDPEQAERRIAEGRLRIEGDPARMPEVLQQLDIHRLLAEHTA